MKVAVILGGTSFERDVSLKTGKAVVEACRVNNYDVETVIIDKNHKKFLLEKTSHLTKRMKSRGGGIINIQLFDCTNKLENYYKIQVTFNTADSMGANFINSCLEEMSAVFLKKANDYHPFVEKKNEITGRSNCFICINKR